jgi:arginine/lysine/ornithine decarboxylase
MMWSPANDDEDYERVSHAFTEVRDEFAKGGAAIDSGLPAYSLPEVRFRYSDILFSDYEEVEVARALGRVSMEAAAKCPPAILPIVPGEVVNEDVIKILNFYGIKTIRVKN